MELIKQKSGLKPLTKEISRNRAVLELILAGALWGLGFTANELALKSISSIEILLFRMAIAVACGEFVRAVGFRNSPPFTWKDMKLAAPAGLILSVFLIFQTVGMEYTTATNSGFITTLYVIFVPLLNHVFMRVKAPFVVYLLAAFALFGAYLMMGTNASELNRGDLLTLVCAVVGAIHIIYLGRASPKASDVIRFNNWQSFFCLLPVIPFWFFMGKTPFDKMTLESWWGVLFLAVGSSVVAFTLQVRAQRVLNDMTASMLFLLESPFAFLFGFIFLSERLNLLQASGAIVILASSALTILLDSRGHSKSESLK
jgi:drug/metabolite transporter (DMT)-like permease